MATAVGAGFDLSKLLAEFSRLDKELEKFMQKGKTFEKNWQDIFNNMGQGGLKNFASQLASVRKSVVDFGKQKVGVQWDSKSLQKYIDDVNKLILVIKAVQKETKKENIKGVSIVGLKKELKEAQELLVLVKRAEKSLKETSTNRNQTYKGSLRYSSNAKTVEQDIQAIKNLEAARAKLKRTDADYEKKLSTLNNRIREHKKNLDNAKKGAQELQDNHKNLINTGEQLKRALIGIFSVSAIKGYINKLVEVRGEFELQHRALGVLTGDIEEANRLWDKTVQLAVKSPFAVKELVTYTKQLAAYRVETDKLYDTTKMLADISAGLGVDMNRLILAYGQVKAANYLRGTELRQFSEAGINILSELSKYFTELEGRAVSVGDVFERVSKRMVSFADVEAVLQSVTGVGGQFYKMQEQQAETLKGVWMNMRDSVDLMLNEIGERNDSVLKGILAIAKETVDNWEQVGDIIVPLFSFIVSKMAVMKAMSFLDTKPWNAAIDRMKYFSIMLTQGKKRANEFASSIDGLSATSLVKGAWGTAITAVILLVSKLVMEWVKHNAEIKAVNEEYAKLKETVSEITFGFNTAQLDSDIEKQKEKLTELIAIANKEYSLNIKINVKELENEEIDEQFKAISNQIINASAFAQESTIALKGKWWDFLFGNRAEKDMQQYGDAFSETSAKIINNSRLIANNLIKLKEGGEELTEIQEAALKTFTTPFDPKKMTEAQYVNRLIEAYRKLNNEISKRAEIESQGHSSLYSIYYARWAQDLGIVPALTSNLDRHKDEATRELNNWLEDISSNLTGTTDENAIYLKTAIDKQSWTSATKELAYMLANEKFGFNITPIIKQPEEKTLADWQREYNKFVETLSTDKVLKMNANTQTEQYISLLKGTYETYAKDVSAWDAGNAKARAQYSKDEIDAIKKENSERKRAIEWLEYENKKNGQSSESVSSKISLIKEMRKEYEGLRKTFDETTSQEKVMTSYAKAFKETFDGLGFSLQGKIIDDDKIEELKTSGEISEDVANKLKELSESGTHIRNFTDDAVSALKKFEGFRSEAYNIGDGEWTIGYGETKGVKKGDTITEEAANARLMKRLTDDFAVSLNKVLDANKDIIITQEQYNALLDMTYQGGSGAVSRLFDYAKNEEKAVNHINSVYEKVKTVLGENSAERFGEAFISKFKSAESIYERIAMLMQTMNLTVNGGQIAKTLYQGMQERSDARAEAFAMGKELNDIFEKAATDFSDLDITDLQGVVDFLSKLRPYAKQKGEEAAIALEKAIASYQSEIGLETQKSADKKLFDAISDIFSNYEISLEMDKLNIPSDLAQKLFGFESIDLNEIRGKVLEKFGLGSMVGTSNQGIYDSAQFKAMSKERQDELRKSLEKESELQDNALKERLKTYTEYLTKEQDTRVRMKLEELRKLEEVEELYNQGKYTQEQYTTITGNIRREYAAKQAKQTWEDFAKTPYIVQMFDDLDKTSNKSLKLLNEQLKTLKTSLYNAGLPASELKEILDKINQVEKELEDRNPFAQIGSGLKDLFTGNIDLVKYREQYNQAISDQADADRLVEEQMASIKQYLDDGGNKDSQTYWKMNEALEEAQQKAESLRKETDEATENFQEAQRKVLGMAEGLSTVLGYAQQLGSAFGDMADKLGIMSEEEQAILNNAMNVVGDVANIGMAAAQIAANPANPAAWVQGISSVMSLIGNIAATGDAVREKEIQAEMKKVDRLEKAYEKLEKAMEDAYTIDQMRANKASMEQNIDAQIKALESANAKEEAMKKKDQDQIDANYEKIAELEEKKAELQRETVERLGGTYDYASVAEEWADAWIQAFEETGDGLEGLKDTFEDTMKNLFKKQVVYKGLSDIVSELQTVINNALTDGTLDETDMNNILDEANEAYGDADSFMSAMVDLFKKFGWDLFSSEGELSGLQAGIQGITETQADILSAYWNAVRFDVSAIRQRFEEYLATQGISEDANPMLTVLNSQLEQLKAIRGVLDDAITGGDSTVGAFRVRVVEMN